jgi:hypothetical protein
MMILNDICKRCNYICNSIHFQRNFINWTSGNNDIDKFIQSIQSTQLSAHEKVTDALEWIPYDRLHNIRHIAEGEFGKVYRANWIDGCIRQSWYENSWDNDNQNWKRDEPNMFVILKFINNPAIITSEFINKV